MDYQKQQKEKESHIYTFTFDVTAGEFVTAQNQAYEKSKKDYSVQGFRKGKVPKKILEGMYGKAVFYEDALDILLQQAYGEVLSKEDIEPVAQPDVDIVKIDDDGVQFTITITTPKPVVLGKYKGLKVKKTPAKVTAEQVDNTIKAARERAARFVNVDNRAAKSGDIVIIDYAGFVGDNQFKGGTAETQELTLGSGSFIPGFEEQVEGMKIGAEKDVKVKFPSDYHSEELKSKDAIFKVKLHEIKVKELPKLDDDFAQDVSEFQTFLEYKADVKAKLVEQAETTSKDADDKALLDMIVKGSDVDVPDSMAEREAEQLLRQFETRLMYQGMNIKDFYAYSGQTADDLLKSYSETAKNNVKFRRVMEALIETEKIEIDADALNKKLQEFADKDKISLDEFKQKYPHQCSYFSSEMLTDALFAFLRRENQIA